MARQSAESLTLVPIAALPSRIEPPSELTPLQADIWRSVAASKPIDWFGQDVAPLLAEYCRAVAMCNILALQIEASIAGSEHGEIKALLDMRDKESRRVASLATKMRLTNQSRYTPDKAATANKKSGIGFKPWQSKN